MKYFKKLIVFHFLIVFAFAEFEKDLQLKLILAEPGIMMPELSRKLIHKERVELIQTWIREMDLLE